MLHKEGYDNMKMVHLYQTKNNTVDNGIRHKKKGEEKFDKNLRISQIHQKMKRTSKTENGQNRTCGKSIFLCILSIVIAVMVTSICVAAANNTTSANQAETFSQLDNKELITTYYVAKNGNDNNPGTETRPWLTISKAANVATAGSTVYVKSGIYKERFIPRNSGSLGYYITFKVYPGNNVTIDGSSVYVPVGSGLVQIQNKAYIIISGFRIINSKWAGIYITGSSRINAAKNYIYNTKSSGVATSYGNNYIVDSNEINLGNTGFTNKEIISFEGVNVFEAKGNYIHDSKQIGIDAKNGASNGKIHHNKVCGVTTIGIYVDAWDKTQSNIEVYSNIVCKSATGIGVAAEMGGTVNGISVHDNLAYNNLEIGIRIPVITHTGYAHLNNIKVFNNVAYHNGYNGVYRNGGIRIGQSSNTYINGLVVRNNIVSKNDFYQIKYVKDPKYVGVVIDHNLIDGYRGTASETKGTNYVEGNPLFTDATVANFRLKSTSPAIDKGSSSGAYSLDFDGQTRPKGEGYDMGSFEYRTS